MTNDEVLEEFRAAGALLNGHFILTSGRRSAVYLNKSLVGMYPDRVMRLSGAMADRLTREARPQPEYVLAPVMGAVVFGYEVARRLQTPFMFLERGDGGQGFALRRGFEVPKGAPVAIVEDVVSSGLSAADAVTAARDAGAEVVAVTCLVDRSRGRAAAAIDAPFLPLATLDVPDYDAEDLPADLAALEPVKPGSRGRP